MAGLVKFAPLGAGDVLLWTVQTLAPGIFFHSGSARKFGLAAGAGAVQKKTPSAPAPHPLGLENGSGGGG